MIIWLTRAIVLAIHQRQLAEHGGADGVRDEALLRAALARPVQMFADGDPPPDLADLATCLAAGLIRTRPFISGNTRTAHVCYRVFLALHGVELVARDDDKYAVVIGLGNGCLDEQDFARWLRRHLCAGGAGRVHEMPVAGYQD